MSDQFSNKREKCVFYESVGKNSFCSYLPGHTVFEMNNGNGTTQLFGIYQGPDNVLEKKYPNFFKCMSPVKFLNNTIEAVKILGSSAFNSPNDFKEIQFEIGDYVDQPCVLEILGGHGLSGKFSELLSQMFDVEAEACSMA